MKKVSIYCYAGLGILVVSCTIFAVFEIKPVLYTGLAVASLLFFL